MLFLLAITLAIPGGLALTLIARAERRDQEAAGLFGEQARRRRLDVTERMVRLQVARQLEHTVRLARWHRAATEATWRGLVLTSVDIVSGWTVVTFADGSAWALRHQGGRRTLRLGVRRAAVIDDVIHARDGVRVRLWSMSGGPVGAITVLDAVPVAGSTARAVDPSD